MGDLEVRVGGALVANEGVVESVEDPKERRSRRGVCQCQAEVEMDFVARLMANEGVEVLLPLPGDSHYQINACKACCGGLMDLQLLPRSWKDVIEIVLVSLRHTAQQREVAFLFREDICKFILENWRRICPDKVPASNNPSARAVCSFLHRHRETDGNMRQ